MGKYKPLTGFLSLLILLLVHCTVKENKVAYKPTESLTGHVRVPLYSTPCSPGEIMLMAKIICHEACDVGDSLRIATGNIIRNRAERRSRSLYQIMREKNQFSCVNGSTVPCKECKEAALASMYVAVLPKNCDSYVSPYDTDDSFTIKVKPIKKIGPIVFGKYKG